MNDLVDCLVNKAALNEINNDSVEGAETVAKKVRLNFIQSLRSTDCEMAQEIHRSTTKLYHSLVCMYNVSTKLACSTQVNLRFPKQSHSKWS